MVYRVLSILRQSGGIRKGQRLNRYCPASCVSTPLFSESFAKKVQASCKSVVSNREDGKRGTKPDSYTPEKTRARLVKNRKRPCWREDQINSPVRFADDGYGTRLRAFCPLFLGKTDLHSNRQVGEARRQDAVTVKIDLPSISGFQEAIALFVKEFADPRLGGASWVFTAPR